MMRTLPVALLVVVLASAASGAVSYLQNGNFDDAGPPGHPTFWTTDIPNWTVTSDESLLLTPPDFPQSAQVGVFYEFGDVISDTGEMVLITNWPDREDFSPRFGTTDITKLTSDPFFVSGDHKWIEFDYVYITQEPLEDGQADPFKVTLIRASNELILETLTVASSFDDMLIDDGGVSIYPFEDPDGDTNRQSPDWIHYKYDISGWAGETVRLVFSIEDTGDDIINSGVFLENVAQTPEPSTFLFFGMGALGLAYAVRRRRRHKT